MKQYYVYILTNKSNNVFYVGVTNDLIRRVYEHKTGQGGFFTGKYNVNKLVYFESTESAEGAIAREKQLKAGSRAKKIALVEQSNSEYMDLYDEIASPPGGSQ